jgi:hypothetical protein
MADGNNLRSGTGSVRAYIQSIASDDSAPLSSQHIELKVQPENFQGGYVSP